LSKQQIAVVWLTSIENLTEGWAEHESDMALSASPGNILAGMGKTINPVIPANATIAATH
jgi:hypothetical protein